MTDASLGKRFWTLWSAFTTTNLGDGLTLAALPLLAIQLTDDARLVALTSVFRYLPFLFLGLPAGIILDRFDRRRIAVVAQVVRAATLGGLATVVALDRATIGALIVASFVVGAGEVLTDGGLPALVRDVVTSRQLEVANSRLSATQTVSNVFVGPPLGALLFELEPAAPFVATMIAFLLGGALLVRLPGTYRPEQRHDEGPFRTQVTVGLSYVWNHPVLRPLALAVALFSTVGEAGNAVFVILATERFGLDSIGFGLLLSIDGVASVAMSFFVARIVRRTSHATSMRIAVVFYAAASLMFGLATVAVVAFAAALVNGVSDPSWNVVSSTVRQRLVPNEIFGRMMTAYLFIAWGMQPVGALVGGVIAEAWGPQWVFVMSGCAVGSLLLFGRPMFRQVDAAMREADLAART